MSRTIFRPIVFRAMVVLSFVMAATPVLAAPDACSSVTEGCDFNAWYNPIEDETHWESDCDGGYGSGTSSGNILHLICQPDDF